MLERGLEPDFPAAAQAEASRLTDADAADRSLQDLRGLLWCSIDNDDSRDLDQLTVAEPAGDDAVRIRVAIADVDRLVPLGSAIDGHAQDEHHVGVHAGKSVSDAARAAVYRPHVARPR